MLDKMCYLGGKLFWARDHLLVLPLYNNNIVILVHDLSLLPLALYKQQLPEMYGERHM